MADFSTGNAKQLFIEGLRENGLSVDPAFGDEAWAKWLANPNEAEFAYWLRGTQPYKDAFPMAAEMRAKGLPFSEAGAVTFKRQVRQLFHMTGLPDTYLSDSYLNGLIAEDISFNELQSRVANNLAEYATAPEEVKQAFRDQLGDDQAIVAWYLDPDHTIQNFADIKAKALTRGYGKRYGFDLGDEAAKYAYGQSADQIQRGLAEVTPLRGLERGTLDQTERFDDTDLARAAFTGDTSGIEREVDRRNAAFSDAGGAVVNQQRTGFGAAN